MLAVNEFAGAIQHLVERSRAPDQAGLRIAADPRVRPLRASVVRKPAPEDAVVVAAAGAGVFLDAAAPRLLDDKELDLTLGPGGRIDVVATTGAQSSLPRP
jgi:hypothetical protein